ncbi:MAG: tRNA 2-selenouridine(34) synthase MnmH [Candidatus Woesearchaeota archaeon]
MIKTIGVREALALENTVFVDTRTPAEYEEAHIPGAFNMPILSNEERVIIGILYKQKGSEIAVAKGKELFMPRVDEYVHEFDKFKKKTIIVHCWRGGLRSKLITELLIERGFNAIQMIGGHKAYREYVRETLSGYKLKPKLIVLHGLTGTGKTELIQKIDLPKLDLEDIAKHRSSIFGAVGLVPRTQKMFESQLLYELEKLQDSKYVIIEGESRKIGDVTTPDFLFKAMANGIHVRINCSLKSRVDRIVAEYFDTPEKVAIGKKIIPKLRQALSNQVVDELLLLMDNGDYAKVTEIILLNYYDPKYSFSLDQIKYDYSIDEDDMSKTIKKLKEVIKKF